MDFSITRIEHDSVGEKEVPEEAYYGVQSLRAFENFRITGNRLAPEMIYSLAAIKKACAMANKTAGALDNKRADAIIAACEEVASGKYDDQFIVDPIQGGAGTSMNMNANEVIANVAITILKGRKGDYSIIHPNDHVNCGQSTNDVIPTAGKMTTLILLKSLEQCLKELIESFEKKAKEFDHIIKMGRTQLQDAVPIRLGQEFKAYASAVSRGLDRVMNSQKELYKVNLGGTAIGTGINADEIYYKTVTGFLSEISGFPFEQADDMIDATQHIDVFAEVSESIKSVAIITSKIANDLRLLSSGPKTGLGEITLPAKQNGSSIMPGKVNPVIPEVVNQACFRVIGNDVTITMATEAGQLELNAFEPVAFDALFQSITIMKNALDTLRVNCIEGITANEDRCAELLHSSVGIVTALCPYIGYSKAAELAKKALKSNIRIKDLIVAQNIMTPAELNMVLDAYRMTEPGVVGKNR